MCLYRVHNIVIIIIFLNFSCYDYYPCTDGMP